MSSNEGSLVVRAQAQIAPTMVRAAEIARVVAVCPLDTPEQEATAAKLLVAIKGLLKGIESERKALVAPYDGVVREVNSLYREPRQELERVEGLLKRRLGEAQAAREEARRRALAETTAAVQAGDTEAAEAALAVAREQDAPGHEGISYRDDWEIVCTDRARVPWQYMVPDLGLVREALAQNPDLQIPGLEIRRTKRVVARGR